MLLKYESYASQHSLGFKRDTNTISWWKFCLFDLSNLPPSIGRLARSLFNSCSDCNDADGFTLEMKGCLGALVFDANGRWQSCRICWEGERVGRENLYSLWSKLWPSRCGTSWPTGDLDTWFGNTSWSLSQCTTDHITSELACEYTLMNKLYVINKLMKSGTSGSTDTKCIEAPISKKKKKKETSALKRLHCCIAHTAGDYMQKHKRHSRRFRVLPLWLVCELLL